MNNSYYNRKTNKFIKYDKIKIENPIHNNKYGSP
jgi:hypothetical protein